MEPCTAKMSGNQPPAEITLEKQREFMALIAQNYDGSGDCPMEKGMAPAIFASLCSLDEARKPVSMQGDEPAVERQIRRRDALTAPADHVFSTSPEGDRRTLLRLLDEARRDQGRYRWLREDQQTELGEPWCCVRYKYEDDVVMLHYEALDTAIDAALAATTEGKP